MIAGFEIGGQMALLAKAFRRKGLQCQSVALNQDFRDFDNDVSLTKKGIKSIAEKALFLARSIDKYDIFYFFWGKSFLDTNRFPNLDIPILKFLGKKVLMHYRGSDLLNIDYYQVLRKIALGEEGDFFSPLVAKQTCKQVNRVNWCGKWTDYILVSTPNLIELVPENVEPKLFPQVINTNEWRPEKRQQNQKDKIVVAHAPTRRFVKGTDLIIQAIENLKIQGVNIELRLIEGMPFSKMKAVLEDADLGIDQLFSGWYGKIAVEMMALGKPVFCYIAQKYEKIANFSPPIVRTTATSLEQDLKNFIANGRQEWNSIGLEGRHFVERHHDVDKEADRILQLLDV